MSIGSKIKEQRNKAGMTQQELADRIELSLEMIRSMENDRKNPSIDTLIKLSDLFGVTTDYLLGRDIESKKIKLKSISDNVNEMLHYILENGGRLPPKETVENYFKCFRLYNFKSDIKILDFIKDPVKHANFMLKLISEEYGILDKENK